MDCSCPIANEVWNYSGWSSVASCTSLCCCRRRSCVAVGGLFTGSWVTTSGSKTSLLPGSIFAGWRLPESRSFHKFTLSQKELYKVPSAEFCLGGAANRRLNRSLTFRNSVIYISPTRIWTFEHQKRPDPAEITPFFRNFPDPTGSLLLRTGNALILGLVSCPRNSRYIAGGQLAVFQGGPSRTGGEAPISESYGSSEQRGKTADWPRPRGLR